MEHEECGRAVGCASYLRRTHVGSHDGEWVLARLLLSPAFTAGRYRDPYGPVWSSAARAAVCSSIRSECSVLPLIVMTPEGPGIFNFRYV